MASRELIEAIAEILCTECDGTDFASLPENVKYLECGVDRTRAIVDKDSAKKISDVILSTILAILQEPTEEMIETMCAAQTYCKWPDDFGLNDQAVRREQARYAFIQALAASELGELNE